MHWRDGDLVLRSVLRVYGGGDAARILGERLSSTAGTYMETAAAPSDADVSFVIDEDLAPEAYHLEVDDQIRISSGDERGAKWAVQTLLQLLPAEVQGPGPMKRASLRVPRVLIVDAPRFSWRGSMLDVARHFQPADFVIKHLDTMAMHKLNVLHLHLTDDQGWRMPVPAYPLLTEVGGWRPGTIPGHQPPPNVDGNDDVAEHDGRPHGGFYTVADIGNIVRHADLLGITVVPEIDMPGHMEAAIAAYPWLGACDHVHHPRTSFGVSEHVLALSDRTVEFCKAVLDAAMELFPNSPIHVGGDECPSREWMIDEVSQATMAEIGATNGQAAQAWFEQQVCQHVLAAGRRVIAWDEVLDGGAPEGTTVMVWRDPEVIPRAASLGFDVIAAPVEYTYFDYAQSEEPTQPLSIGGPLPLEKVANLHTVFDALDPAIAHRVLGGQFQLWSEYLRTPGRVEFFAWPRGASVAQQLWSGGSTAVSTINDLEDHLQRLNSAEINWCRPGTHTTAQTIGWGGPVRSLPAQDNSPTIRGEMKPISVNHDQFPHSTSSAEGMHVLAAARGRRNVFVHLNVEYARKDGLDLHMHIIEPSDDATFTESDAASRERFPCITFVQGSAWGEQAMGSAMAFWCRFAERGYVVALMEYRPSALAGFPAQIQDAKTAIRWLRHHADDYSIDSRRLAMAGDSSGGHTALMVHVTQDLFAFDDDGDDADELGIAAFIDFYGATDLSRMNEEPSTLDHMGPDSPEGRLFGGVALADIPAKVQQANPSTWASSDRVLAPLLMIHGSKDRIVPFAQSVYHYEALREAGHFVELVQVRDADHGILPALFNDEIATIIDDFLTEHLF